MLEIIALIFLGRKNGDLAVRKGLNRSTWIAITIVAWLVAEFAGAFLFVMILQTTSFGALILPAYGFAIISYFIVRGILDRKPDVVQDHFDFENGQQQ